jgi:anti-anti-sigma factor
MGAFTIQRTGTQSVVAMGTELTAALVPSLQTALKDELSQGMRDVIFDMGRTEVMDSSGIGLLIATRNSVSKHQGEIKVINLSPEILQLLFSMRLVSRLNATSRQA